MAKVQAGNVAAHAGQSALMRCWRNHAHRHDPLNNRMLVLLPVSGAETGTQRTFMLCISMWWHYDWADLQSIPGHAP